MTNEVVVVRDIESRAVVIRETNVVSVQALGARGPAGPPGPQGPASLGGYEYVRDTAASAWIIDHALGRKVHVTIYDHLGFVVFADVEHSSIDQCTITFHTPFAGAAVIS